MKIERISNEVYIKEICEEDIIDGTLTIPDGVTIIEKFDDFPLFSDNTRELITSIIIPDSVTSIGDDAFDGCENLIIKCHRYSAAEKYAIENNIPYEIID